MSHADRHLSSEQMTQELLKPILYTDIFDYPLTAEEICKFLECEATVSQVRQWLAGALLADQVVEVDGFFSLPDRADLAAKRQARAKIARRLWPRANLYGRWIASLPFVTMVAITGSLAVNNPRDGLDDIDFLIVTRPGRLWLCRAMIILMVRFGHTRGVRLCPNYLITENAVDFEEGLFTARELMQMVPLYGADRYLDIKRRNGWITDYFPQGNGLNLDRMDDELSVGQRYLKKIGEVCLAGPAGNWLESWLQHKQISKHTKRASQVGTLDKVIFTPDVCKGHFDGHNQKTMRAYRLRLRQHINLNGSSASSQAAPLADIDEWS